MLCLWFWKAVEKSRCRPLAAASSIELVDKKNLLSSCPNIYLSIYIYIFWTHANKAKTPYVRDLWKKKIEKKILYWLLGSYYLRASFQNEFTSHWIEGRAFNGCKCYWKLIEGIMWGMAAYRPDWTLHIEYTFVSEMQLKFVITKPWIFQYSQTALLPLSTKHQTNICIHVKLFF